MLRDFDVHTMQRLPTGNFYARCVKANVLFFHERSRRGPPVDGAPVGL